MIAPLQPEKLFMPCDPSQFDFVTTEELADAGVIIGQERALDAIRLGLGVSHIGFNIYALGTSGSGKLTAVREIVQREAAGRVPPEDWCYVNNFENPAKPLALRLPAGWGKRLVQSLDHMIEELSTAIPSTFEGEEYRSRAEQIEEDEKLRELREIDGLRTKAKDKHISLVETPTSYAFRPLDENGEALNPEQFEKLSTPEQHAIQENITQLHQQLQKLLRQFTSWRKETKVKIKKLNNEFAVLAISHHIAELKERYRSLSQVVEYLDRVEQDIYLHVEDFFPKSDSGMGLLGHLGPMTALQRYKANLIVYHGDSKCAPVVYEDLPNHANLIGRIEHQALMGALITDFTMIRPGALHLANGGYLILDAHKLLMQPYAWESLKRALQTSEIRIESLERTLSLISTVSLEPEPIPLHVKIILVGDRTLHYLLNLYDPEFRDLFKISADFEENMIRDQNSNALYARVIASLARRESLRPLNKSAVVFVIEYSSRLTEDSGKLSTHLRSLTDLIIEADYWAAQEGRRVIDGIDVKTAINSQLRRADQFKERIYEAIRRGMILVDVSGEVVGQINALSVVNLGGFWFGQPSRVTATCRMGQGKIIDIERETELGGPIHSKGVLILSGFIGARYACDIQFSVIASIVFEQSYGLVEGDSASLAELCALLSSFSGLPIKQSLAVTGSVNQFGLVQPVGGVNEKIEGFYDVCKALGKTGQGVIIPSANVKNLMLRSDVVDAAREERFSIYAIETVDQALELLMGKSAGERQADGKFPQGSVNGLVEDCLRKMNESRKNSMLSEQPKLG